MKILVLFWNLVSLIDSITDVLPTWSCSLLQILTASDNTTSECIATSFVKTVHPRGLVINIFCEYLIYYCKGLKQKVCIQWIFENTDLKIC